jgi:ActR/RegA family two-component response regulator
VSQRVQPISPSRFVRTALTPNFMQSVCRSCSSTVAYSPKQYALDIAERLHECLMTGQVTTPGKKVLLVDDNEGLRTSLRAILESRGFHVSTATNVTEALHLIDTQSFDVLLSDLHMPGAGDGFTVVSAMRHVNPMAVTLVFTGFPALREAMNAILLQADEVLVKPMSPDKLIAVIEERMRSAKAVERKAERVGAILERSVTAIISDWLSRLEGVAELTCIPLSRQDRTGHIPKLIQELVSRLRVPRELGTRQVSEAAVEHGKIRLSQGYSIPMIVEESRIMQVSIFYALQKNLSSVDFSLLLPDVMTIADEVDSQLQQAISSFMEKAA